jgi:hypothetical protein
MAYTMEDYEGAIQPVKQMLFTQLLSGPHTAGAAVLASEGLESAAADDGGGGGVVNLRQRQQQGQQQQQFPIKILEVGVGTGEQLSTLKNVCLSPEYANRTSRVA